MPHNAGEANIGDIRSPRGTIDEEETSVAVLTI